MDEIVGSRLSSLTFFAFFAIECQSLVFISFFPFSCSVDLEGEEVEEEEEDLFLLEEGGFADCTLRIVKSLTEADCSCIGLTILECSIALVRR